MVWKSGEKNTAIGIIHFEKVRESRWVNQNIFLETKERTEWITSFGWHWHHDGYMECTVLSQQQRTGMRVL